ncbi:MAG: hypothetical protein KDD50_09265 [Bdellovibrionales bacterium]|nr:hypothetical protein [Bdellovibrionales bacterium]
MLNEELLRKAILFYFFTFNDEGTSLKAAKQSIRQCQKRLKNTSEASADEIESTLIYFLNKNWNRYIFKKANERFSLSHETSWKLYDDVSLGWWRQFLKESNSDEYLAVVCSLILKFKEQNIAHGFGVSKGTVRHRINRGLRKLASLQVRN